MSIELGELLVPEEILRDFSIRNVTRNEREDYVIELEEKTGPGYIPKSILRKGKAVQNGFCSPLDLQGFPVKGHSLYLRIYRRRWRVKGSNETGRNEYSFNYPGMKATKEFGDFLKGEDWI